MTDERPPIEFRASTASTNDLALQAARDGAPHGTCFVADRQTAGRGRREVGGERRTWFSPEEANIYMSVLLRPEIEPPRAAGVTLAIATALCDLLREETGVDVMVKWPNDLLVGSKKLAGVLTEAVTEDGTVEAVVVGLGLNVNVPAEDVPDELEEIMTSLLIETDSTWDRLALLEPIRGAILDAGEEYRDDGLEAFVDRLQSYDYTAGKRVRVSQDGDWVEGTARGITADGQLTVDVEGEQIHVGTGEVQFP